MEIPAINLKAIVLVHWLLTVWGCLAFQLNMTYMLSNFSVLAVGVWAIAQRDSIDAVLMFLMGMALTVVTDIVDFAILYPAADNLSDRRDTVRFSMGMSILSLLLKPLSCFFVYQMYRERGGDYNVNFGFPTITRNRDDYQSIDNQEQSSGSSSAFNQGNNGKSGPRSY
ncbi:type-1 angiotensin II receptor-associated protein [Chanos chanos]|uniref:Type-1 angiotensin II receptor-associated protein n=1 Tax=Chanos chanos TaxID=29144 RepID=A0A6J2VRH7_CHACN|nr:type-1 angiotensin II receptor-associated protein [Chanos chanos]